MHRITDKPSAFHSSFGVLSDYVKSQFSHVLCPVCAGGELRATGQVGRSQTDAGEAVHPAACCQEHVQADGHSSQQDALLQCKKTLFMIIILVKLPRFFFFK